MSAEPTTPFDDLSPRSVLSVDAVADRLGVSPRSVRRAIARGELQASRTCGLRVLAADAADWWRRRIVVATPPDTPAPQLESEASSVRRRSPSRRFVRASGEPLPLPPRRGDR